MDAVIIFEFFYSIHKKHTKFYIFFRAVSMDLRILWAYMLERAPYIFSKLNRHFFKKNSFFLIKNYLNSCLM